MLVYMLLIKYFIEQQLFYYALRLARQLPVVFPRCISTLLVIIVVITQIRSIKRIN